jgi:outer membrane murein-binding lipoprotein Lpp
MKKLIVLAIVAMICLAGCTLSGLDMKVDNVSTDKIKTAE